MVWKFYRIILEHNENCEIKKEGTSLEASHGLIFDEEIIPTSSNLDEFILLESRRRPFFKSFDNDPDFDLDKDDCKEISELMDEKHVGLKFIHGFQ
jgi:hypothetical protein